MPTNLPPEYYEVERRYRAAKTTPEKIDLLEEMMGTIPKHKGTDKLRADLRRRISKLKSSAEKQKKVTKHESVFHIEKEGAGRAIITGFPNVGKSSLISELTNAAPAVSQAPFTTWEPTPGMMTVKEVQIQLIDTPPLNPDHIEAELMDLIKTADLILLLVDLQRDPVQQLNDSLSILKANRIVPPRWKERYNENEHLNIVPVKIVVNKYDDEEFEEDYRLFQQLLDEDWPCTPVSTLYRRNMDLLKENIFTGLDIIRVYSKPPGKAPDFSAPFVLKQGGTIEEFAGKVHQDFIKQLKTARVWGTEVYDGQMVGRDHILHDGDVVELHM